MTQSNAVPMMFRAQVAGRCQLQRIDPKRKGTEKQDVQIWTEQWIDKAEEHPPQFSALVQTRSYQITWRFITNGGQDDGIIRPVIGARGVPFYPGSSMKGLFRRACHHLEQTSEIAAGTCDRLCGNSYDLTPGILRFHGGYPTSGDWTEHLLDIVHPQQSWQVKSPNTKAKQGSAYAQISLYKPELQFGISSIEPLSDETWQTIWKIWETALSMGLGCRVSSGYGQVQNHAGEVLHRFRIKGQGQAPKQLNGTYEFRPNLFRAALRGHALRIFGGLTHERNVELLVDQLFGGIQRNQSYWGLLSMGFRDRKLTLNQEKGTYEVTGDLTWHLTQPLTNEQHTVLKELVLRLMQFAMVFGGFGKSWRRADHRLFMDDYDKQLIGCHWQWDGQRSPIAHNPVRKLEDIPSFLAKVQASAIAWMTLQGMTPDSDHFADWREAWHPANVQVWGRVAGTKQPLLHGRDNCIAIRWLHQPYAIEVKGVREVPRSIKGSTVSGHLNCIGRLWHRMYPVVLKKKDPKDESKWLPQNTPLFLELLTLFPDETLEFTQFQSFLDSAQKDFVKLWG
ncbi:MAG: hypothetical protein WCD18_10610 [Thermosynechococcaceae cyanobacterium]